MFGIEVNLYCFTAAILGLFLGYVFAHSSRQQQPNGNEIAALFGTVLGGGALNMIEQFRECHNAFALYVLGVVIGYIIFVFILKRNWVAVERFMVENSTKQVPFFPWRIKHVCVCQHEKTKDGSKDTPPPPPPASGA